MRCKGLFMLVVPGCQDVRETEAFVGRVSRVDVGFTGGGIWGYLVQGCTRSGGRRHRWGFRCWGMRGRGGLRHPLGWFCR